MRLLKHEAEENYTTQQYSFVRAQHQRHTFYRKTTVFEARVREHLKTCNTGIFGVRRNKVVKRVYKIGRKFHRRDLISNPPLKRLK
jgi:hypothetical protein